MGSSRTGPRDGDRRRLATAALRVGICIALVPVTLFAAFVWLMLKDSGDHGEVVSSYRALGVVVVSLIAIAFNVSRLGGARHGDARPRPTRLPARLRGDRTGRPGSREAPDAAARRRARTT